MTTDGDRVETRPTVSQAAAGQPECQSSRVESPARGPQTWTERTSESGILVITDVLDPRHLVQVAFNTVPVLVGPAGRAGRAVPVTVTVSGRTPL